MASRLFDVIERRKIVDLRGFFLKTMTGFEDGLPQTFGEIYVIKGEAGQARANHYHNAATEWFTILQGQVRLNLKHVDTGETASVLLTDEHPVTVRVNPRVAHSLVGIQQIDYILMAYTDVRYDPVDTIAHSPIELQEEAAPNIQTSRQSPKDA